MLHFETTKQKQPETVVSLHMGNCVNQEGKEVRTVDVNDTRFQEKDSDSSITGLMKSQLDQTVNHSSVFLPNGRDWKIYCTKGEKRKNDKSENEVV